MAVLNVLFKLNRFDLNFFGQIHKTNRVDSPNFNEHFGNREQSRILWTKFNIITALLLVNTE